MATSGIGDDAISGVSGGIDSADVAGMTAGTSGTGGTGGVSAGVAVDESGAGAVFFTFARLFRDACEVC